jgi:hypothetical protein
MCNMTQDSITKPVVHFTGDVMFPSYSSGAVVHGVLDHPRLGVMAQVWTSEVLVICEDGKSFETLNTVYKQVELSSYLAS